MVRRKAKPPAAITEEMDTPQNQASPQSDTKNKYDTSFSV
jgi:hypothetical protein